MSALPLETFRDSYRDLIAFVVRRTGSRQTTQGIVHDAWLREASLGLLDRFGKPAGTLISANGTETPAGGRNTASGFALPFIAKTGASIVAVAKAKYSDRTPGERDDEKYAGISYMTSLTCVKPAGVAPIAAGPAVAPNPAQ